MRDNTPIEYRYLGSFTLSDYSIETNIFKSEFSVDPVINEIEAASAAEIIWGDIYSYDVRRKNHFIFIGTMKVNAGLFVEVYRRE